MEKRLIELNLRMLKTASLKASEVEDYLMLIAKLQAQLGTDNNEGGQLNDLFKDGNVA